MEQIKEVKKVLFGWDDFNGPLLLAGGNEGLVTQEQLDKYESAKKIIQLAWFEETTINKGLRSNQVLRSFKTLFYVSDKTHLKREHPDGA